MAVSTVTVAWLWAVAVLWAAAAGHGEDSPSLSSSGPHEVGVRVETRLDRARPFRLDPKAADESRARPIRMLIWYPAAGGEVRPTMSYADYLVADSGGPPDAGPTVADRQAAAARLAQRGLEGGALDEAVRRLFSIPLAARLDATPAPGRFPLVVIAPGGNTPPSLHALLGEHLASHGYVSVAIPSLPRRQGERWPFDPTGIDLHLRDLETALDHLLAWPSIDRSRIGLVGWSVGGVAQLLMQMRNPDIGALVSLDGASGYAYGLELLRQSIHFDEAGVSVPYLHAHGLAPARFEVEKDFTVFESLSTGPSYLLTFPELSHADFMSRGLLERWAADPAGSGRVVESYSVLMTATRRFLDAFLTESSGADQAFRAWLNQPEVRRFCDARARP